MKKIRFGTVSVLTLAFLFAGNILYGIYPSSGNPVLSYICISVFLPVITFIVSSYFLSGKNISRKRHSSFLAVLFCVFTVIPLSYTVSVYTSALGSFAKYYSSAQVVVFAVVSVVISGICTAQKGVTAVMGLARMSVWFMIVWIFAGWLGFAHTKNIVSPLSPFRLLDDTDFVDIAIKGIISAVDIVLLFVVLTDNRNLDEKKHILPQIMSGVWLYIAVSGVNMLKNLLLFGSDFLGRLDNPDLAAIRLIPMFELPEISVVVDTVSVVLKISVYLCAVFYALKDAFAEKYRAPVVSAATGIAVCGISFVVVYIKEATDAAEILSAASVLICAAVCMVFFSEKEK